ncbi:hypothetical protein RRG08_009647 [Elysia crispata]|uniref:Uncharacterized protein n=1 Tax=Elysia crispata TaxID=231223 RepID=A0AAE1DMV6_9GAST|nr:hypothetical protein RRG08_009647 [Elysia crispata]
MDQLGRWSEQRRTPLKAIDSLILDPLRNIISQPASFSHTVHQHVLEIRRQDRQSVQISGKSPIKIAE